MPPRQQDERPFSDRPNWCCMCGALNPKPLEVCPVSEYEMVTKAKYPAKKGLTHLLAYSAHAKAVATFEGLADTRAEMRQGFSKVNLTNIRARLEGAKAA